MRLITFILILVAVTLSIGCRKKPAESTQSSPQPNGSSGVLSDTGVGTAASVPEWVKWARDNKLKVSEWAKVKLELSGNVTFNGKGISQAEFAAECERLKKVGGGIVIFIDTAGYSLQSKAQTDVLRKIEILGVPLYPYPVSNRG